MICDGGGVNQVKVMTPAHLSLYLQYDIPAQSFFKVISCAIVEVVLTWRTENNIAARVIWDSGDIGKKIGLVLGSWLTQKPNYKLNLAHKTKAKSYHLPPSNIAYQPSPSQ